MIDVVILAITPVSVRNKWRSMSRINYSTSRVGLPSVVGSGYKYGLNSHASLAVLCGWHELAQNRTPFGHSPPHGFVMGQSPRCQLTGSACTQRCQGVEDNLAEMDELFTFIGNKKTGSTSSRS